MASYLEEGIEKIRKANTLQELFDGLYHALNVTNSYGVPMERVAKFERAYTREELEEALQPLEGRDLCNDVEGITAQVNKPQRGKFHNAPAIKKSMDNGFSADEHMGLAAHIERLWKWAARNGVYEEKNGESNTVIGRYVAAISIGDSDAFAWITVKHSVNGDKIYSLELMDEKKLKGSLSDPDILRRRLTPTLSFEEIIERLKKPVNGKSDRNAPSVFESVRYANPWLRKPPAYGTAAYSFAVKL